MNADHRSGHEADNRIRRDLVFIHVDAVLSRRPQLALVDELARSNVPESRNEKRWQDVEELLDAGINVVSTVNIRTLSR